MSFIQALLNPSLYKHPVDNIELVETHISWVILTGPYAYKIKKPVNFGFLDFSTLSKRQFYCLEELRLNQRLAPQLYLDVVAIYGDEINPSFQDTGPVIEYAVKMKQFPQSAQLDRLISEQGITNHHIDQLANKVADFHLAIDPTPANQSYGSFENVRQPVMENFSQIRTALTNGSANSLLNTLESWVSARMADLCELITQRKLEGFIRECHGDMHLRNIALIDDEMIIFDCIEFNPNLYHIDIISDIAFLVMDLEDRNHATKAQRFLNRYLEITGDYTGLALLKFYKLYRAMVRAKVYALQLSQLKPGSEAHQQVHNQCMEYLLLARSYIQQHEPCLIINHGLSGSGKTFHSYQLLAQYPAIIIRSDIERKRLFDTATDTHQHEAPEQGIYSNQASAQTYERLESLARTIIQAGYSVIIDATNLKVSQRHRFAWLAKSLAIPFLILHYQASEQTLKQRIQKRIQSEQDASDANIEVLEHQLGTIEQLTSDEVHSTITIDTENDLDIQDIVNRIKQQLSYYRYHLTDEHSAAGEQHDNNHH